MTNKMNFETDGKILPHGSSDLLIQLGEDEPPTNVGRVLLKFSMDNIRSGEITTYRMDASTGELTTYTVKTVIVCQHPHDPYDYLVYGEIKNGIWSYITGGFSAIIEYLMKRLGVWR